MANWNIDETPYPGPVADAKTLYMKQDTDWSLTVSGSFEKMTIDGINLPSGIEINDFVEVVDWKYDTIFTGYFNNIEVEYTLYKKDSGWATHILLTNKLVDTYMNPLP